WTKVQLAAKANSVARVTARIDEKVGMGRRAMWTREDRVSCSARAARKRRYSKARGADSVGQGRAAGGAQAARQGRKGVRAGEREGRIRASGRAAGVQKPVLCAQDAARSAGARRER